MTIQQFTIESVQDVKDFFQWLANNDMLLHPDDDFNDIIDLADDENPACITSEQADQLNDMMNKCFDVCEEEGVENYALAYETVVTK